jgi:DNA-binding NarL/FixJ family response regulator
MRHSTRPWFCLIVEDDPAIGLALADALQGERWFVAGPFTRGRDALNWLDRFSPDVALVGHRLRDGMSEFVIEALTRHGIPIVRLSRDDTGPGGTQPRAPSGRDGSCPKEALMTALAAFPLAI